MSAGDAHDACGRTEGSSDGLSEQVKKTARPKLSTTASLMPVSLQVLLVKLLLVGAIVMPRPANADNGIGGWSALASWPLIPIHAVLLGDGRVMTYGTNAAGQSTGNFIYDVWNPRAGRGAASHLTLPNSVGTNLFCNAQLVLPGSGDVFLAGGDIWNGKRSIHRGNSDSVLFRPSANELRQGPAMQRKRYYATVTTLSNGETYIQGGLDGEDLPEIRSRSGGFRLLSGVDTSGLYWWYPRAWVAPNGRIFGYSDRAMYYVSTAGDGSLTSLGSMPTSGPSGATSSEVMFAPGRILRVGGGGLNNVATETGKSDATIIDINGSTPELTPVASMPTGLHWHTATVVADGRVVVTGGSLTSNQRVGVSTRALIWNPATGRWSSSGPGSGKTRLYHSVALLLPDATVLVGGGGAPGPQKNLNAEIYYPPYLYTPAGAFAARPRITSAPRRLPIGGQFALSVNTAPAIQRVTLIKAGSVTHSFNMEQRFMELPFTRSGGTLQVTAPTSRNLAPPGLYLLFVIDAQGVPSVARLVSIAPPG